SPDTTGALAWNGADVTIEVRAEYRGITRSVVARYQPKLPDNYYTRLATVQDWLQVNDKTFDISPFRDRHGTVNLDGYVWEYNNGGPSDTLVWQGNARRWVW